MKGLITLEVKYSLYIWGNPKAAGNAAGIA